MNITDELFFEIEWTVDDPPEVIKLRKLLDFGTSVANGGLQRAFWQDESVVSFLELESLFKYVGHRGYSMIFGIINEMFPFEILKVPNAKQEWIQEDGVPQAEAWKIILKYDYDFSGEDIENCLLKHVINQGPRVGEYWDALVSFIDKRRAHK
jgi:hypothetical protein